jgi:MFS superfamily sulfate permease-like transporter
MALLKLGALVDLISLPVTVGFTSATALIIGASQLKVRRNSGQLNSSQPSCEH